jgi:hypothetical protein
MNKAQNLNFIFPPWLGLKGLRILQIELIARPSMVMTRPETFCALLRTSEAIPSGFLNLKRGVTRSIVSLVTLRGHVKRIQLGEQILIHLKFGKFW